MDARTYEEELAGIDIHPRAYTPAKAHPATALKQDSQP